MKEYTGKTVKIMTCSKCNTKCKFYRKVYIFLFETKNNSIKIGIIIIKKVLL